LKHFLKIADNIDVSGVVAQLADHPELWNEHLERTRDESPHYGVDDIWVRYRRYSELTSPPRFNDPHFAEFYPAWYAVSALGPIVFDLMARVKATYLGGILITRIPAGGRVKPHDDRGGWHAENMDTKVYLGLKSNSGCVNYCEDESLTIKVGEAWTFNNLLTHSVVNNGDTERITAIVCFRTT
jgi:hypothetical protein